VSQEFSLFPILFFLYIEFAIGHFLGSGKFCYVYEASIVGHRYSHIQRQEHNNIVPQKGNTIVVADNAATRMTTRRWHQLSRASEHQTHQQYDGNFSPYPHTIKQMIPKVYYSPFEYTQMRHNFYMEIQYLSIFT
jgi:hypothetical protein